MSRPIMLSIFLSLSLRTQAVEPLHSFELLDSESSQNGLKFLRTYVKEARESILTSKIYQVGSKLEQRYSESKERGRGSVRILQ